MNFKNSIDALIEETIIPEFGNDTRIENIPNETLLSNLSSYMYDHTLDDKIEQYSKDIDNLQFKYQQINEMISYLTDLNPPVYRKKCILICYIFLKIRNIDTPIGVRPAISLDKPNTHEPLSWGSFKTSISGLLPGMPTFSMPRNLFGRSTSEPELKLETETDMSELLFIAGILMLLDEDDFKPS